MRRQDVKPGVVYAHQHSDSRSPVPVVFLSTDLYTAPNRHALAGGNPADLRQAPAGVKPGKGYLNSVTGYPVVFIDGTLTGPAGDTLQPLRDATMTNIPRGARLSILTALSKIKGEYAPAAVAWEQQKAAERAREHERRVAARARNERGRAVTATLARYGIPARWAGHLEIHLDDAEKLAALLGQHPAGG
jgi:hypothetical protein